MNEVQKLRFVELGDKESLTAKEQKEFDSLIALSSAENKVIKNVLTSDTNNTNYSGVDTNELIIAKGLKIPTERLTSIYVTSVDVRPFDQSDGSVVNHWFVKGKTLDSQPIDLSISNHHYESFGFSNLLPKGNNFIDKIVSIKVISADKTFGYYDKRSKSVKAYWKTGLFIIEPRNLLSDKEQNRELKQAERKQAFADVLAVACGGTYDPTKEEHQDIAIRIASRSI